jgi:hypothetical protein
MKADSLGDLRTRCVDALTRWLTASDEWRAEYEELRSNVLSMTIRNLPDLEREYELYVTDDGRPTVELVNMIEQVFQVMVDETPRYMLEDAMRSEGIDDVLDLYGKLRREHLPLTSLEGDHYGPD